ncbi:MAG: RidA family protein [Phycisphaeraceae bacterium]|nr:RidA family protein [Phycisphaeraceae bacterium]
MASQPETRKILFSSGSIFESEIGYSRAVAVGDQVFVSGTTGFDYSTMSIASQIEQQAEHCLLNISAALNKAGATISEVVRVHYILPDASEFPRVWPILRKHFGESRPAATMFQAGLADSRMRIEIEVTSLRGCGQPAKQRK